MSKRFFINNIDTYVGQALLNELVKEDTDDPTIMATYTQFDRLDKQKGVKKILKRYKPKLSRLKMLQECDVYVYDLHYGDLSDINFGVEVMKNATLEEPKVFILISNIMTWANTPPKEKPVEVQANENEGKGEEEAKGDQEEKSEKASRKNSDDKPVDGENAEEQEEDFLEGSLVQEEKPKEYVPLKEEDFALRIPHENYNEKKDIENIVLGLQKENLKVFVICSGMLYGKGEYCLRNYLKAAWLQDPSELPYFGSGENKIPTIHVSDLAKFIIKVSENPPENSYLFAFDNTKNRSQKNIIESISKGVGGGKVVQRSDDNDLLPGENVEFLKVNLDVINNPLLITNEDENGEPIPGDFDWTCERGIPNNARKILEEYRIRENLRPIKILLSSVPGSNEEELRFDWVAEQLSQHYKIPIIRIAEVLDAASSIEELAEDLEDEMEQIQEYFKNEKDIPLNESTKVLFRAIKWRLTQNDCHNRGYVLLNYPKKFEETKCVFMTQKLKRKKPKKKKVIPQLVEQQAKSGADSENKNEKSRIEGDGQGDEDQEENRDEANSDDEDRKKENEGDDEENKEQENGEKLAGDEKGEEEKEEEPPVEEEEPVDDGFQSQKEEFYPESMIVIKKIELEKLSTNFESPVLDYFSSTGMEVQMFDTRKKSEFEIFECLRVYIERNGRPNNYLISEKELQEKHKNYYENLNNDILRERENNEQKKLEEKSSIKAGRSKLAQNQVEIILNQEIANEYDKYTSFRNYLMECIVPVLGDGLCELSTIRPEDPIDFLAEFLYKKSFDI